MIDINMVIIQDTPDRFRAMADRIVLPLLELLHEHAKLETEIFERDDELRRKHLAAGGSPNQLAPGADKLHDEYFQRYLALVQPRCVPGFLKYGASRSFGKPAKYSYLDDDPTLQVIFTMKSPQKAIVETHCNSTAWAKACYPHGVSDKRHRFTLKPAGDTWLIARLDYAFSANDSWHIEHCL